ncbi:unnamed protein product [Cochlearia groenlandica]
MSKYGTIPTSSHPPPSPSPTTTVDLEYISRAKQRIKSGLATRRPWRTMFDLKSITIPQNFSDAISRSKTNLNYFRANYAVATLFLLFLSLIYHPKSLLVFTVLVVFWIFLYFLRDESLVVLDHQIGDRTVMICLSILTVVFLLLTHATCNIVVSLVVAVALVLIHAVVRKSDDLFIDEEDLGDDVIN